MRLSGTPCATYWAPAKNSPLASNGTSPVFLDIHISVHNEIKDIFVDRAGKMLPWFVILDMSDDTNPGQAFRVV
jgi:hypothetical protein